MEGISFPPPVPQNKEENTRMRREIILVSIYGKTERLYRKTKNESYKNVLGWYISIYLNSLCFIYFI